MGIGVVHVAVVAWFVGESGVATVRVRRAERTEWQHGQQGNWCRAAWWKDEGECMKPTKMNPLTLQRSPTMFVTARHVICRLPTY